VATIGVLFTVNAVGYTIASFLLGRLYDRRPGHPMLASWLVLAALAMLVIAVGDSIAVLSAGAFVVGFAGGGIDTGANALTARVHGDAARPLVLLHSMFGVGASAAPLLLAASRRWTDGGIGAGLAVMAAALAGSALLAATTASPHHEHHHADVAHRPSRSILLPVAAFFFLYVGLEIGFAGWIFTFATDRGFDEASGASWLTSAFWIAFTVGRLAGVGLAHVPPARLLAADFALSGAGALVLGLGADEPTVVWIATAALGLGFATMFPAMLNQTAQRVGLSGTTSGAFVTGAGAGNAILPWLIGLVMDDAGTGALPWLILASVAACAFSARVAFRALDRHPTANRR
jgi:FHS family Na+ dependent glucose MFS transporter 1